jgi:hypothetical protein
VRRFVLSVWPGRPEQPAVVFLSGTMTDPLFYEEFLDGLDRAGDVGCAVRDTATALGYAGR